MAQPTSLDGLYAAQTHRQANETATRALTSSFAPAPMPAPVQVRRWLRLRCWRRCSAHVLSRKRRGRPRARRTVHGRYRQRSRRVDHGRQHGVHLRRHPISGGARYPVPAQVCHLAACATSSCQAWTCRRMQSLHGFSMSSLGGVPCRGPHGVGQTPALVRAQVRVGHSELVYVILVYNRIYIADDFLRFPS